MITSEGHIKSIEVFACYGISFSQLRLMIRERLRQHQKPHNSLNIPLKDFPLFHKMDITTVITPLKVPQKTLKRELAVYRYLDYDLKSKRPEAIFRSKSIQPVHAKHLSLRYE